MTNPPILLFMRSTPIPAREDFIFKEVILGELQLLHLVGDAFLCEKGEPHFFVKEPGAGAPGHSPPACGPTGHGHEEACSFLSTLALKLARDQSRWSGEAGPFPFQNAAVPPDPPSVTSSSAHPFSKQGVIPSCVPADPLLGPLV